MFKITGLNVALHFLALIGSNACKWRKNVQYSLKKRGIMSILLISEELNS